MLTHIYFSFGFKPIYHTFNAQNVSHFGAPDLSERWDVIFFKEINILSCSLWHLSLQQTMCVCIHNALSCRFPSPWSEWRGRSSAQWPVCTSLDTQIYLCIHGVTVARELAKPSENCSKGNEIKMKIDLRIATWMPPIVIFFYKQHNFFTIAKSCNETWSSSILDNQTASDQILFKLARIIVVATQWSRSRTDSQIQNCFWFLGLNCCLWHVSSTREALCVYIYICNHSNLFIFYISQVLTTIDFKAIPTTDVQLFK